jgi:hypothetical protein
MSKEYLSQLSEVEKLISKMDLPSHRKSIKHNDDLRWLKNNLAVRNSKHKNYEKVIQLLETLV